MICGALFEGDTTQLLPKITSFSVHLFVFIFIFLDFFRYFENLEKEYKFFIVTNLGGDECQRENKLVSSSETYLCSMQGNMCRIMTLGGKSPPGKKWGIKLQKICKMVLLG